MALENLDEVLAIERRVFSDPWSETAFLTEIEAGGPACSRVALTHPERRVAGYYVAWFVSDEVHLGNLAVAPSHQGQGLGQKLLDHLLAEARHQRARKVTLEVRETNWVAQRLYLKNGFQPVAIRKRYYPDNREDAIVMLKTL
jgi:ribosomal-protein-alanine N-acetyltransferase